MTEEQKQPVAKSIKERAAALITHEPRVLSPTEFYEFAKGAYVLLKEIANAPEAEPVAYIEHHKGGDNLVWDNPGGKYSVLYTAPLAMKLSDERILEIWASNSGRPVTMGKARIIAQARAIERELLGE